jgi:NADPH:quinone reductase-like Zn-dependent oxidoreductase
MRKWMKRIVKWTALTVAGLLVLAVVGVTIGYWMQDNQCEERLAQKPANPMKAVVYCDFGGADVLRVAEVEKPTPGDDQVLVKVRAVSVNPYDWHFMTGTPYLMRMGTGLRRPNDLRLGVDFSGVVEAVGKNVTELKPGDAVFGGRPGAFAEYIVAGAGRLGKKPENVSFEEAAGVNIAGRTALQALREFGNLQPGEKVLINGASGGVGTYAVQMAKHFGAEVTGVSSGRNTELVRSLGADHTVDYTQQDYTQSGAQYDLIVDNVGSQSLGANRRVLKANGRYIMVGGPKGKWLKPMDRAAAAGIYSMFVSQKIGMMMAQSNATDLPLIADLMQQGKVKTVIDQTYHGLEQVPDAMRHLATGRARGKIVVTIADEEPEPAAERQ